MIIKSPSETYSAFPGISLYVPGGFIFLSKRYEALWQTIIHK